MQLTTMLRDTVLKTHASRPMRAPVTQAPTVWSERNQADFLCTVYGALCLGMAVGLGRITEEEKRELFSCLHANVPPESYLVERAFPRVYKRFEDDGTPATLETMRRYWRTHTEKERSPVWLCTVVHKVRPNGNKWWVFRAKGSVNPFLATRNHSLTMMAGMTVTAHVMLDKEGTVIDAVLGEVLE